VFDSSAPGLQIPAVIRSKVALLAVVVMPLVSIACSQGGAGSAAENDASVVGIADAGRDANAASKDANAPIDAADAGAVAIDDAGLDAPEPIDAPFVPDDISGTIDPFRKGKLPAIGAAVWRGPQLIAIGAAGARKAGDPTQVTIDDQWHLGSDTKAMTATLIGLYVDRGMIHFEDTIGTLFAGETIDPGYSAVTIEELLQHIGGAPGTMPADIWSQMWTDGSAPTARITAVRSLISRAPEQAVGTFVYSNAGYMIAGAALERVLGMTWEEIIQNDLFGPLNMSSCGFGAPGTPGQVDEPWGHQVDDAGAPVPVSPGPQADNPPSLGPAGVVHCALADWGKFLAVHLAGARGEPTIVSQATMTRLQTPPAGGDYACGWIVTTRSWAGGTAITHSGSNTLWYATAWLAPAKNLAFAVVTNRGDTFAATQVDSTFGPLIQTYAP
jgi:CubicO group peptidase (beta-lactamase class C family)